MTIPGKFIRFTQELGFHLFVRAISAASTFLVFALIAKNYATAEAVNVFFFSFLFGFALATVRSLHTISADLQGSLSRSKRLRRTKKSLHELRWYTIAIAVGMYLLFFKHSGSHLVTIAAVGVLWLCAFEVDLVRAAIGRSTLTAALVASGGLLSLGFLQLAPYNSAPWGCMAFVLQWLPAAIYAFMIRRRFHWPSASTRFRQMQPTKILNLLVLSVFDGAISNAAFLLALKMPEEAAYEISIGTRLYVAGLLFFPLIAHWGNQGEVERFARRSGWKEGSIYFGLQALAGIAAVGMFTAFFTIVTGDQVSEFALMMALVLLILYAAHMTMIRFVAPLVRSSIKIGIYCFVLVTFYSLLAAMASWGSTTSWTLLIMQMSAMSFSLFALWQAFRRTKPSAMY